MRKKNDVVTCIVCGIAINPNESFVFNFNEEFHFFCDSHAEPFKMGISLGQLEINSKFLSFISNLPDPVTKSDLKKALMQLAPLTKLQNIKESTENIFQDFTIETPQQLYDEINKSVIGQDIAKQAVSVAVINHLHAIEDTGPTNQTDKHHVLLLGKSGSGKTLIVNTISQVLNLPYVIGDATNYSPTGFHGADAESVVYDLLLDTDMNFELTERGIIFIDELDKICCANKNSPKNYESFIGTTQSTFLKLVEGKIVKVPGQVYGDPPGSSCNVDTSRMLFFFGGAFNGLSDIVAKKMGLKERSLGFKKENESTNKEIDEALKSYEIFSRANREQMVDALIEFGMLSELVGRIPTIAPLKPLSKTDLMKVLMESNVSPIIKQKNIFLKSGYNITFTEEFLNKLVDAAYNSSIGTRALDSYVKTAVSIASFDLLTLSKNKISRGNVIINADCLLDPSKYEKNKIQNSISIATSVVI